MSVKNAVNAIELASFASSGMSASYQVIDASGIEKACYVLRIVNNSSQGITVSFDGATDHAFLGANTTSIYTQDFPAQNNAQPGSWVALWSRGTKVYVKGTAGTGTIYLSGLYVER